jgi:hypothetical protein
MGDIEAALAAIEALESTNYSRIAKEYGVDRRTLARRHQGQSVDQQTYHASRQFLSKQQTKFLVKYIKALTNQGLPPTPSMVRQFAVDLTGKRPGKNWPSDFLKRHEDQLQSRYLRGFDLARKKADSYYHYKAYFEKVRVPILVRVRG